jgi:hypothetical protein
MAVFRSPLGQPFWKPTIVTVDVLPPINLFDWPTPPPLPTPPIEWIHTNLALGVPPPPAPFQQTDWPAPIPPYRVYAEARSAFIPLLHSVQPPIALSDWPPPRQISRIYIPSVSAPPPMSVVVAPFNQDDWPQPPRFPSREFDWIHTNLALGVPVVPSLPPIPGIWPLPVRPPIVYAQSYSSPYVLTTTVVVQPFSLTDWPIPRIPPVVYAQNLPAPYALLTVVVVNPFGLDDWPKPILPPVIYAQNYSSPYALITTVVVNPFSLTDWPLPVRPPLVRADSVSAYLPLLSSVQPPIAQLDWPPPKTTPPPVGKTITLAPPLAVTAQAFSLADWPSPIRPYIVRADAVSAYLPLLNSVQPPIVLSDWPLPTQPARVYAQSYGVPETLLTPPVPAINQPIWPVPVQPGRVYADVRRADMSLLRSAPPPTNLSDWPTVHRLRTEITKSEIFVKGVSTPLLLQKPFKTDSWPIPLIVPSRDRTQGLSGLTALQLSVAPTFNLAPTFFNVL